MSIESDQSDTETDLLSDPLEQLSRREPALRWKDTEGEHRVTITGRQTLGSAPQADLTVSDAAVSRLHAELALRADDLWVNDLGSRNGTFIDGVFVESARLHHGSTLRVGTTEIDVDCSGEDRPVPVWPTDRFGPLFGRSVIMRELFSRLDRAARSGATVLLQGETGTGKELAALALHQASPRAGGPFVVIDCAGLAEGLLESELFGHAMGAYSGAVQERVGALEAANGGTVFLDEIGELTPALQPKLLRVMESHEVRRVGENKMRAIDVHFIAATHRDLRRMVNEGSFREDLYFRLAVLPLTIPPLRERREDIPLLVRAMFPDPDHAWPGPEVQREISRRPWRGNVRELRNYVERARAFGFESMEPNLSIDETGATPSVEVSSTWPFHLQRTALLDAFERKYLTQLLALHEGKVTRVAKAAGLDRTYIYRLMRKHGL